MLTCWMTSVYGLDTLILSVPTQLTSFSSAVWDTECLRGRSAYSRDLCSHKGSGCLLGLKVYLLIGLYAVQGKGSSVPVTPGFPGSSWGIFLLFL